ncbi:MAG: choice-of-anchor J domain-containing protein, partial [Bacteroidales bacterium]
MSKVFTKLFFPLCLLIAYSNITLAQTIILEEGFEGGSLPTGWTVVDADGDGQNWSVTTSSTSHSGSYYIMSRSWNTNPLNPNNYLITPLVEGATNIKYYFKVNVNYPYEHYAVMASTTGNALTNFQIIFEETATATNDWIERNINLPAGTKYVAFRHYNSTDQDYLALDDITIFSGNSACPPITNLTATSNPNNTVTLSWTNPPQSEWASDEPYYWFYDDEIEIGSDNTYNLNSWTTAELTEGVHSLGVQIGYYSTIAEDYICKADIIFVEVTITNVEEIKTSLFSAEIFPNP